MASPRGSSPCGSRTPRTAPANAARPTSSSAIRTSFGPETTPPAAQLATASSARPADHRSVVFQCHAPVCSLALPEPVDDVEPGPATRKVRRDRRADAEQAPEKDLDRRVVERVEVAHRDQEAEPRREDRPQREREPGVADRVAGAVNADERRADDPHDERPADEAGPQHEGQVHVLVVDARSTSLRASSDL